jgi:hypothetical protein
MNGNQCLSKAVICLHSRHGASQLIVIATDMLAIWAKKNGVHAVREGTDADFRTFFEDSASSLTRTCFNLQ